jgi:deoxyribose-phosphate aldolase
MMMDPVRELAKMIDHSLLHPTMTDEQLRTGCETAKTYDTASVCIKPYAVAQAREWLAGSGVLTGTVIGFPHGNSAADVKAFETERACSDGADEIDMVVNVGKVLSDDWKTVEHEIRSVLDVCRRHSAVLKVIFENDFLPEDRYKIRLCEICTSAGAEFVKTSTGYGFVRGADGRYSSAGATDHDLRLMIGHVGPAVRVKAAGGIRTLDDLLRVKALGVARVGATATVAILEEAKARFGGGKRPVSAGPDTPGY